MRKPIPVDIKPRMDRAPRVKVVDFDEIMKDTLGDGAQKVMRVETYAYDGGQLRVYDYATPAIYQKYSPNSWGGNLNTGRADPYVRVGHDNRYPFFVLRFSAKSATFQRAYGTAINVAAGDGFLFDNLTPEQAKPVLEWLDGHGFGIELNKELLGNILLFGGAYPIIRIVPDGKKVQLKGVDVINYQNMRVGKPDIKTGEITRHWHSMRYNQNGVRVDLKGYPLWKGLDDFNKHFLDKYVIDRLEGNWYVSQGMDGLQGLGNYSTLVCNPNIYSDFYPKAAWQSDVAINAALMEDALFSGDVALMENGLSAGYIVTVARSENRKSPELDKEEKEAINTKIRGMSGAENKGKVVVMYADARANTDAIKIAAIPHVNTADMGTMMEERKDQALLTAWGVVDGQLIGIPPKKSKGLTGQATVLAEADDIWYATFIHPEGVMPLESFYNKIVLPIYTAETGDALPANARLRIKRLKRFNLKPDKELLMFAYSKDEIRAKYGDDPLQGDALAEVEARVIVKTPTPPTNG